MKGSFLSQTEIISILGGFFVYKGHSVEGWILISLGIIGAFIKFAIVFQSENHKEERRILTESDKSINELTKRISEINSK